MSAHSVNRLGGALLVTAFFGIVAVQGCSSDTQATPSSGGGGGKIGSNSAGAAGKPASAGSDNSGAGTDGVPEGGSGGAAGEAGAPPVGGGGTGGSQCALSFDNTTLAVLQENGGKLPKLP